MNDRSFFFRPFEAVKRTVENSGMSRSAWFGCRTGILINLLPTRAESSSKKSLILEWCPAASQVPPKELPNTCTGPDRFRNVFSTLPRRRSIPLPQPGPPERRNAVFSVRKTPEISLPPILSQTFSGFHPAHAKQLMSDSRWKWLQWSATESRKGLLGVFGT